LSDLFDSVMQTYFPSTSCRRWWVQFVKYSWCLKYSDLLDLLSWNIHFCVFLVSCANSRAYSTRLCLLSVTDILWPSGIFYQKLSEEANRVVQRYAVVPNFTPYTFLFPKYG